MITDAYQELCALMCRVLETDAPHDALIGELYALAEDWYALPTRVRLTRWWELQAVWNSRRLAVTE